MDAAGWDERYQGRELVWGAGPNRFLVAEVEGLVPGTALDVACGEGRNAIWLAEQGWRSTGVDFSAVALHKARALADQRGVEVAWIRADLSDWEPPGRYDLVAVMYLQLPAEARRAILGRLAGAVAPAGSLVVVAHDLSNLTEGHGGPQDASVLYGPEDVVADIGPELTIQRAERVRRPVSTPEGEETAIDLIVRARRGSGVGGAT